MKLAYVLLLVLILVSSLYIIVGNANANSATLAQDTKVSGGSCGGSSSGSGGSCGASGGGCGCGG